MKKRSTILAIFKYLALAILILLAGLLVLLAVSFRDLKAAGQSALAGKGELEASIAAAKSRQWPEALDQATLAQEQLGSALADLDRVKERKSIASIFILRQQVDDLAYLVRTAEIISRTLQRGLPLAKQIDALYSGNNYNFATLPPAQKAELFKLIYESEPELNGLKANLELALLNFNKIHKIGILWPIYGQLSALRQDLQSAVELSAKATPLMKILPALAGYPGGGDLLIIMQNNDELRPAGGFIGVYGLLNIKDGEIVSLDTSDSYHLDMPAVGKWQLTPPEPIKKYMKVENWYLRDSNWSPDWPTSANQIQTIFYGESRAIGQTPPELSGVIGITPDFVAELIRLVGSITVKGETYTPENLQSLLQYNVEVAYKEQDISSWNRKEIINDLIKELQNRLSALPSAQLPQLLSILSDSFISKDVQIFFNNPASEELVKDIGAAGVIKEEGGDYLLVADANLAAFKSDSVVKKSIDYRLSKSTSTLLAKLDLNYRHEGGFDWRTTRYRSYTRVYVQAGSRLISIKATGRANLESDSISTFSESGKTVFGFFFYVEPGTEGGLSLQYALPDSLAASLDDGSYKLLIQKQAGRRTEKLRVDLNGQAAAYTLDKDLNINYAD